MRTDVEWDPAKARSNLEKHGISFSDAEAVLFDPMTISMEDQSAEGEDRFVAVGCNSLGQVSVVCYTYRGDNIRMISARPATKRERNTYEERVRF